MACIQPEQLGQYQHLAVWLTVASLYPRVEADKEPKFGFLVCFYSVKMFNKIGNTSNWVALLLCVILIMLKDCRVRVQV